MEKWSQNAIVGGLLGQWAVWTSKAVTLLEQAKEAKQNGLIPAELLTAGVELTDANAAIFDAANGFKGSIAGINEILRAPRLIAGTPLSDGTRAAQSGSGKRN